jgi:hypothetical protein
MKPSPITKLPTTESEGNNVNKVESISFQPTQDSPIIGLGDQRKQDISHNQWGYSLSCFALERLLRKDN